uniref:Ig-like domain-containing protein n=1 Tax=Mola mola TaxID=94237 RepID=A0A3Q3XEY3_MOLML
TCLFNSQIPHGNASLLLRRVKVQDKGRYKCYTTLIQSVIMEMTEEMITCSAHNIYPVPQVLWTTDPPSAQEALEDSTMKTADHKGLFTVESKLRILGNSSNYTYFCSFISADKAQVWTASWKKQDLTQEEGHALSIPCIAPLTLPNFTFTWTFTSSSEPTVILRYDTKNRHMLNLWEGHAELDQELLLLADGSLLIHKPDPAEHSGTYTCTFSGVQSKHTVWTSVNITVSSTSPLSRQQGQKVLDQPSSSVSAVCMCGNSLTFVGSVLSLEPIISSLRLICLRYVSKTWTVVY